VAPEPRTGATLLADIASALASSGLVVRGGLNLEAGGNEAGALGPGVQSVILVGNTGGGFWPVFELWRARQPSNIANPLDTWSREILVEVAGRVGAVAVSPSDRPFLPFQQWAMRAEALKPSPLGILMHPEIGLWHAYRGALLFEERLTFPRRPVRPHICDTCREKPCLSSCPVGAHSVDGFAYTSCLEHVRTRGLACRTFGCLDRNACPHGAQYRYPAAMQEFLMRSFADR